MVRGMGSASDVAGIATDSSSPDSSPDRTCRGNCNLELIEELLSLLPRPVVEQQLVLRENPAPP
jgi:hypothetical protein